MSEADPDPAFRAAVLTGLAQVPKVIPARYLYDRRGSELFEAITDLPEYYPTRTEIGLLQRHVDEVAMLAGPGRAVVEFGSGSSTKTPILLNAVAPASYVPVDIAPAALDGAVARLRAGFPALDIRPLVADFMADLALPMREPRLPALGFFPGSTIGNLGPAQAVDLLRRLARALGDDAMLLIGVDPPKDPAVLERAYDDARGVTAAFDLNLLTRVNRELDGDMPVDAFRHRARWNAAHSRVEMHLEALQAITFTAAGQRFAMAEGETIHTENSHKYAPDQARLLARAGGWEPARVWTDADGLFTLQLWSRPPARLEP